MQKVRRICGSYIRFIHIANDGKIISFCLTDGSLKG